MCCLSYFFNFSRHLFPTVLDRVAASHHRDRCSVGPEWSAGHTSPYCRMCMESLARFCRTYVQYRWCLVYNLCVYCLVLRATLCLPPTFPVTVTKETSMLCIYLHQQIVLYCRFCYGISLPHRSLELSFHSTTYIHIEYPAPNSCS